MNHIEYPFHLLPSPYGTRLSLSCQEEGGCVIELNVLHLNEVKRARLVFSGFVKASINDRKEQAEQADYMFGKIIGSQWVQEFLQAYVEEFGAKLLPAVNDVEHFFVNGHDGRIELLARKVEISFDGVVV